MTNRGRSFAPGLLAAILSAGAALAAPAGDTSDTSDIAIRHLAARTIVETGRTRVIAFDVPVPVEAPATLVATVSDDRMLAVVREPAVLAGERVGYLRVRGLAPGRVTLTIAGAPLAIDVVAPRVPLLDTMGGPEIVGPSDGAAVWGRVTVGVETRLRDHGPLRHVRLELPGGRTIEPVGDTHDGDRPYRGLVFEIDADREPPGPLTVTPITVGPDGGEVPGRPVRLRVVRPGADDLLSGEAERRYDAPRPERFRDARLNIGRDRAASGGKFFVNNASLPAVCVPVTVDAAGWYQLMVVASGTRAQGALPTVSVVVDNANDAVTNGRLLQKGWHRFAVGVPFRLEPGDHTMTPYFQNDFAVRGLSDRNLRLDRFELARLAPGAGRADDPAGDRMTMMDGAATMMAMDAMGAMDAMANAADAGPPGAELDDPFALRPAALRIAFVRPLDGHTIPGVLEIEGRAWWAGLERTPAPTVTLEINGAPVMTQRSGAPRFWVDPSFFAAGANRVRLVARLGPGTTAATPVQTMHFPAEAAEAVGPRRVHHRFSIHDERWEPQVRELLVNRHYPKERRAMALSSNGAVALALPADLTGRHTVFLEAMGERFEGAPIATVTLRRGDATDDVGAVELPTGWGNPRVGSVNLAGGDQQLVVAFENDHFVAGRGDRNLLMQSVILVRDEIAEDLEPPVVTVHYPPDAHPVYGADALVAEVADNASLVRAELEVDGMDTGMTLDLNLKPGRVVFPLLLRELEAGPHTVAVRVTDRAGNSTTSEPRTIVVADDAPVTPGAYTRAVRLLDRFAYGPDANELAAVLTLGEDAWLRDRLGRAADDPGDAAALGAGIPYFVSQSQYDVPNRVISHALLTPNPVRARFALWAQNHFSTWIRKIDGRRKWPEHVTFARLGPAPFAALLRASAESPAMLGYLDQEVSYAGRINENFAREIMELHTLGVDGGYTQRDVTNLASILTGWTSAVQGDGRSGGQPSITYSFRFDARLSDGRAREFLGMAYETTPSAARYDRVRLALEQLAAHPSTARFVSRSLAEHYVSVPAPAALVDDLETVFLETDGDLRAMLRSLAAHPAFWSAGDRLAQPIDYALRLGRAAAHYQPWAVGDYLRRSGAGVFDRPTPDGYPEEDVAWTDSNAVLQRWRLARDMTWPLAALAPNPWRYGQMLPDGAWEQRVTDAIAVRMTGHLLSRTSNEAALGFLDATHGTRDERIRMLAPFIAQLPEANLK